MTQSLSRERRLEIIHELDYDEAERAWLAREIGRISPEHKIRGMMFDGDVEVLRLHRGQAAAEKMDAYVKEVELPRGFMLHPIGFRALLGTEVARSEPPRVPTRDRRLSPAQRLLRLDLGAQSTLRRWGSHRCPPLATQFRDNPVNAMVRGGVLGSLPDVVKFLSNSMVRFHNFGETWFEELGHSHLKTYFRDHYARLFMPIVTGVLSGVLELVGVEAKVEAVYDPDIDEAYVELTW